MDNYFHQKGGFVMTNPPFIIEVYFKKLNSSDLLELKINYIQQ